MLPPLAIVALLVAVWQLYANLSGIGNDVLPPPSRVLSVTWENRGDLWANTLPTLRATLLGLRALARGRASRSRCSSTPRRHLRRALMPVLVATQTLPIVAIAPLMVLWFGFGLTPKVLLVALVTFFPITVAFAEGFAASEPEAEALLRSMGASRARVFRSVRFPTSLPFFFAGLRIAITYAVVAAIFAEYAGASEGLGIYMQNAKNSFRTDLVLAAVLVSAAAHARAVRAHLRRRADRDPVVPALAPGRPARVSAAAPKLELRGLGKRFGELEVLRDLSLEARAGEFVAILGPSGCGKSTAFSILTGGTPASAGEVLLDGAPRRRRGGRVRLHAAGRRAAAVAARARQRDARARGARDCRAARRASACGPLLADVRARRLRVRPTRSSSRAACASARRCCAPSCRSARCCCSTSRSARSTRSRAPRCSAGSSRSGSASAGPSCSSPTTCARRSTWPTASTCSRRGPGTVVAELAVPLPRPRTLATLTDPLLRRARGASCSRSCSPAAAPVEPSR